MPDYTPVLPADVPAALRRTVEDALRTYARDLRLDPLPDLEWFRDPDRPCHAFVSTNEWAVFVNVTCPLAEADAVVAHELRHVWQRHTLRYLSRYEIDRAEEDAEAYARRMTGRSGGTPYHVWRYG